MLGVVVGEDSLLWWVSSQPALKRGRRITVFELVVDKGTLPSEHDRIVQIKVLN